MNTFAYIDTEKGAVEELGSDIFSQLAEVAHKWWSDESKKLQVRG